ncbi:copper homeostasis membrane protein CopD [Denitratimonas sp. CY0512]|uniref:copper homeostasis membrane protein CopD n=1 Tax=Denitratimonas sp. CY0512 TaxID=3131940 RepID=UPI0030A3BDDE
MALAVDYALRFIQYLDLLLLFGIPLYAWYARGALRHAGLDSTYPPGAPLRILLLAAGLLGVGLLALEVVRAPAAILGLSASELVLDDFRWYLLDTAAGRATLVRLVALLLVVWTLAGQRLVRNALPVRRVSLFAGIALATLAWNGHAAAGDGAAGSARLVAGVVHLLAAGAWLGAIAALLGVLVTRHATGAREIRSLLHAFALPGSVIVGLLAASGAFHYADLLGWSGTMLFEGSYGRLMALKLALFGAMLVLAALHRWWLVPRLERKEFGPVRPRRRLQWSIGMEGLGALLIVLIVSVLGLLSPYQ